MNKKIENCIEDAGIDAGDSAFALPLLVKQFHSFSRREGKMRIIRKILFSSASMVIANGLLGLLRLKIQPQSFPSYPKKTPRLNTVPLPAGLPPPVERFYRSIYGEQIPVIETVVIQGRGVIKPIMNIPIPARFVFVHNAGMEYRHYFEATLFGMPLMRVNEGYLDGASFFESPLRKSYDDANSNQGANLALWAEAVWFPALFVTDPRVHWNPWMIAQRCCMCLMKRARRTFCCAFTLRRV